MEDKRLLKIRKFQGSIKDFKSYFKERMKEKDNINNENSLFKDE